MKKTVICFLLSSCCFAAVNIPLTVQEALYAGGVSGISRANESVTVGVPLPDSAGLTSTSVLALSGATAAQFSVEGWWPDGNIKWLKIRATVPSLAAGGSTTLTLTDSGSGNFGGGNLAVDNGSTITVNTGTATFTIKKANFNVVDQVVAGGKTVVTSGSSQGLVLIGPDPNAAYPGNVTCLPAAGGSACSTVYTSANDPNSTAVIEENGPAVAVIKATGSHVDASGHVYLHFTTRMYFYKNQSYIKVTSILRNADYGAANTFASAYKGYQGYEIRIRPNITGTLNYKIANDGNSATTGTLNQSGGTDYAYLYQAESTLMKTATWCRSSCVPYTSLSGYSIVANGAAKLTGSGNQYPQGWADISDANGVGVEIGQYQLAAYGNKSLEFRGGGNDVRIGMWASENNTTSTSSLTPNKPYYIAWPQYSINDVYLNFHSAAVGSPANEFLKFQYYLVARASVAHYNSTNAFLYPLLDPAEEDQYYNSVAASASPAVSTVSASDIGVGSNDSLCNTSVCIWRYYPWADGGGANQMEFRLSRLFNFLRRGYTGGYLASAHFYKFEAEQAFPLSDGFNWRDRSSSEVQYLDYPTATSTNGGQTFRNWAELDQEHANWQGLTTYYFLTGDETYKDAVIEGPKDAFLDTTSANNYTTRSGVLWNGRSVGNTLKSVARLYEFLSAVKDPDADAVLANGQSVVNVRLLPDFCSYAGYPAGCTPDPLNDNGASTRQIGVSRVRGIPYAWGDTSIGVDPSCSSAIPSNVRSQAPLFVSIELEGMWEYLKVRGPGWSGYDQMFDLAYGITQWVFNEMYVDNGQASWVGNGFRYKMAVDYPNGCNSVNNSDFAVKNELTHWYPFYILHQYEGSTSSWKHKFDMLLQRNISDTSTDEFFHYTIANVIYSLDHPNGSVLQTVPISGFADNGGGSYTISWTVPQGTQSYRIKWGPKQIVDWIGFNPSTYSFIGNPAATMNWFAATDAAGIPVPAAGGTTQSLTISTATTGLTAANFAVKAYAGGSSGTPAPGDTSPPAVSMAAPAGGATVNGTVTVSASASDNVGVSSVQFRVDGTNLGAPLTGGGPSYSMPWDTTKAANGSHTITAVAADAAGNTTVSGGVTVTVSNTATGPVISGVSASSVSTTGAIVTWTTDVASDSQVAYGTTTAYGSLSPLGTTSVTSHSVALSGLASGTTYHFQVMSRSASGTLATSGDYSFTTTSTASSGGSVPLNSWTKLTPSGFPAQIYGYDKSVYVNSRKIHCVWGGYHQTLSSEPNNATVCFSYAENRWFILQNNGMWHSSHVGASGHSSGVWAYMPDRDVIAYYTDGSGSNSQENFLGHWWWFDVGGLSGQDKEFSPRPWLGVTTPASAMVYDTYNSKLVLFPDYNGVVEICDPAANSCSAPGTSGTAAPNMGDLSMAFNSANHLVYVFGGGGNDIYTFDAGNKVWTKLAPTCSGADCTNGKPPARRAAGFAYSTADNIFLMAGGVSSFGGTAYTDTWVFDPVAVKWTEQAPASKYPNDPINTTFDRVTYDPDSNVFIMLASGGNNNYAGGTWGSYTAAVYAYAYSAAAGYGRVSNPYAPVAGSLNRVSPSSSSQSWAFDPAIAASGTALYAGWLETGTPFDGSNCGLHHPYIQSSLNNGSWTALPGGSQSSACTAIDPEPSGNPANTDDSKLRLAVVNGTVWEAHERWNTSTITSSAWAKSWNGSSWTGGQVGCFTATCSSNLVQNPQALIASGATPTLAVIEWNHVYVPEGYLYVAQWNGSGWSPLGGKLNINTTGTRALAATLASDGTYPAACWSEEVDANGDRRTVTTTPQIQCARWNGSGWTRFGSSSLNRNASSWAYDPSMTYAGGKFYIGWVERTTSGANQLFVCRWDGSSCALLGGGPLNMNASTGWAAHPSLATDGTNVYVAWEEQAALGQHSLAYVKRWDGTSWTAVGGALNADAANGSVEGISLAVSGGAPVAIWGELSYGNLRQTYAKQWNGSAWSALAGAPTPPAPQVSCDVNGDGTVNSTDIQLATNQALGTTACGTADLQQNGKCDVVDVQRVINASLGGTCVIGQ